MAGLIIAATGHRPDKLGGYSDKVFDRLVKVAEAYILEQNPEKGISVMALGWDQAYAQALCNLGIDWEAAVPFESFYSRWPSTSQAFYFKLLAQATTVTVVSDWAGVKPMQIRNEYMVDNCDKLVSLWDGSAGGTYNCLRYAKRKKVPVDNLWDRYDTNLSHLLQC